MHMTFYQPQNFKKGRLVAGGYRIIDLVMIVLTTAITFFIEAILLNADKINVVLCVIVVIPILIILLLTIPLGNYHNLYVFGKYYLVHIMFQRRNYKWGGIYLCEEIDEEL